MKTKASIWGENMRGYLSLEIICSSNMSPKWRLLFIYFRAKWRILSLLSWNVFKQDRSIFGRGGGGGSGIPVYPNNICQNTQKFPKFLQMYPKLIEALYTVYPKLVVC